MQVKIREAAEILNVSVDTIRRRLKAGELEGKKVFDGGVEIWLVSLPDSLCDKTRSDPHPSTNSQTACLLVANLERELEETRRDRDRWYGMAMGLIPQRD